MTMWTLSVLIWLSPVFGGEGLEGRPLAATITFYNKAGCESMVRQIAKHQFKYRIVQPCAEVEAKP